MKRFLKVICVALTVALLMTTGLTGCGNKTTAELSSTTSTVEQSATSASDASASSAIDTSKEVTLKTYLVGDKPADYDLVLTETNKLLKQKVNATMDVAFLSWGEYIQKYPLIFASGEDFDMVFAASWVNYKVQAVKNAYMELSDEMLQKYAPKTFAEVPAEAWKQTMVNGKKVMVPYTAFEFGQKLFLIRGDLREKYNIPEIKTLDDVQNYLYTIADKEKGIIPYDVGELGQELEQVAFRQPNGIESYDDAGLASSITDPEAKLFWLADDSRYLDYLKRIREWKNKGVIPSDAASKKNVMQESFKAGKTAMTVWNLGMCSSTVKELSKTHPEWKTEMVDIAAEKPINRLQFTNNGMAVKQGSKNAERALMVIDLLRNDKELWDLSNYGIQGKHWEPVGDDKYKAGPDAANFPAEGACQWGWKTNLQRQPSDNPASFYTIFDNWKKNSVTGYFMNGFAIDTTNVKTEAASMTNLRKQYLNPLTLGAMDPDKYLAEYKTKAKAAGFDKYFEEAQKQAKAYVDSMK